jgi:N-acetylglutamate synthase-like GNAT family acetyltransferase
MLRECGEADYEAIREMVNESAQVAFRGVIPADLYREPWMTPEYFDKELSSGVRFFCFDEQGKIQGVMGVQDFPDVTLIRHAYVRPARQRECIGSKLLCFHLARTRKRVLVGCLKAMTWAVAFYENHGFTRVSDPERDELRARYWTHPPKHVAQSVVLVNDEHRES